MVSMAFGSVIVLLAQVCTVSVETMKIVRAMP
jgi:hypothetical protein